MASSPPLPTRTGLTSPFLTRTCRSTSSACPGRPTAPGFSATARGSPTRPTQASTRCGPPTRATSSGSAPPFPTASITATATPPTAHGSCTPGSTPTTTATLFSVKPDGSDPVQLSPPGLSIIDLGFFDRVGADWSPDGSRVVFAAQKPGGRFITASFVVNADGTGLRQITPSGIGALSAQWSPNGDMIAFTRLLRPPTGLGRPSRRQPGSDMSRLAVNRDFFVTPVWSPDSTKLLLNKVDRNNQASLWTANLDGSGLVHLADTPQPSILDWGSAPAN